MKRCEKGENHRRPQRVPKDHGADVGPGWTPPFKASHSEPVSEASLFQKLHRHSTEPDKTHHRIFSWRGSLVGARGKVKGVAEIYRVHPLGSMNVPVQSNGNSS